MRKDPGDCGLKVCVSVGPPCDGCCPGGLHVLVATLVLFIRCMDTVMPL